jgi:integrase
MKSTGPFKIRKIAVKDHGCHYVTFLVEGYLNGRRVRKKLQRHDEAMSVKARLDIESGNSDAALRVAPTRLSSSEIAEAEFCFRRLGERASLSAAIEWYLCNYRPPAIELAFSVGQVEYLKSKLGLVEPRHLAELRRQLSAFASAFPSRSIHTFKRPEIQTYLEANKEWSPKTWNNVRGILHSFFNYAANPERGWAVENPVKGIAQRDVPRGLPTIKTAAEIAQLFAFLQTYTGGKRNPMPRGFLIPYFALATFAGLRPSVPSGEIWKMGHAPNLDRLVDVNLGVLRITPEIAKTGAIRQVKMRPNLIAWLKAYPLATHPLVMPNMSAMLAGIRERFLLGQDVLRHTFISMHVARFKSMGEAALEAGNSEAIIRRHYLNMVSEEEADQYWSIVPRESRSVDALRHVA